MCACMSTTSTCTSSRPRPGKQSFRREVDAVVSSAVMLSVVQQWVRLNSFLCTIQCSWRHTMWYTTKVKHVQRASGERIGAEGSHPSFHKRRLPLYLIMRHRVH